MNFDKKSLSKLLLLSDEELIKVLKEIAKESGVAPEKLKIGKADVIKIRAFLSMASDDDIARLLSRFGGKQNG
jgi:hypothetical protein